MASADTDDKRVIEVDGRYLVTSTASKVWIITPDKRWMQPLIEKSTGGIQRSMIIEHQGFIAVLNTNDLETMWLGGFESFDAKVIQ